MRIRLEDAYRKVISFLNKEKLEYIVIGGFAAGALGEPRMTGDIDIDILLERNQVDNFLDKAKKVGFKVNKRECEKKIEGSGVFQISYGDFHIDFIIASIDLEKEAFKRRKAVILYGLKAFFPTPEDFILLKIIPARRQDLLDIERVVVRHGGKLDVKYLRTWAQKLSDRAEDMRIYNELQRILE